MKLRLDEQDIRILKLLQENCKLSTRKIAEKVGSPVTTVFTKIRRMEKLGFIEGYRAVLDAKALGKDAAAFILASFAYHRPESDRPLSQRELASQIARFPEVQEVHIITGDWDILIKIKARDVDAVGKFIIDKLRLIKGIEKTLTCMVFETLKESTHISLTELAQSD